MCFFQQSIVATTISTTMLVLMIVLLIAINDIGICAFSPLSSFKSPNYTSFTTSSSSNYHRTLCSFLQQSSTMEGECKTDWEKALASSSTTTTTTKAAILKYTFVGGLLENESVDLSEIEEIWIEEVGENVEQHVDEEAFARFWYAVDGLFEYEDIVEEDNSEEEYDEDEDESQTTEGKIKEIWFNPQHKNNNESKSLGESIGLGEVVLLLTTNIGIDTSVLRNLFDTGRKASNYQHATNNNTGRNRFPASDSSAFADLADEVLLNCEDVLLTILDAIDENIPSIYSELFCPGPQWAYKQPLNSKLEQPTVTPPQHLMDTCPSLRDLYMAGELEWSEGEPAINIYTEGGYFGAHKDHLALTILVPLSSPQEGDFKGGGTGFWKGNRAMSENPGVIPPDFVLTPNIGEVLVFGGDVTHQGMAVQDGVRGVFVASFSTRTEASPLNRVQGLNRRDDNDEVVSSGFQSGF